MTPLQLLVFGVLYAAVLAAVVVFTRATGTRIAGALAGSAVVSAVAIGGDAFGQRVGWWRMTIWGFPMLPIVYAILVISLAPILLVTWRVARRFGRRGLAVSVLLLTVLGPPRDYSYVEHFPGWGSYAPGIVPILAVAALYAMIVPLGHAVMRRISGPPAEDPLG